jgi:hypothetical protein
MIVFNTLKKAQHYVKHKTAQYRSYLNKSRYYNDEEFMSYQISENMVLCVSGWQCGCGCDRGSTSATVIGRIKSV